MWIFDKIKEQKRIREELCTKQIGQIDAATEELNTLFACRDRFISDEDVSVWSKKYQETISALRADTKTLKRAKRFKELSRKSAALLSTVKELEKSRNSHNEVTANERAEKVYSIVGQVEGKQLDRQQLVAISKNVHTHLVLAGAGTGKTTTIVGLVKYYLMTKKYSPNDILVLSFTNTSASEMRERLQKETGLSIEASTFHKLGMNIITDVEGVKPKITEIQQSKFIRTELETLMLNEGYLQLLNMYLIKRQYIIRTEFDFKSMQEYRSYLKKNPPVSLKQETMKSYGEVEIANFLFLNGIEYEYEAPYKEE